MNLHQIVRGPISAVNPDALATVYISTGNATGSGGKRTPQYAPAVPDVPVNIQPLSPTDIRHVDSLNIEGVDRAIYINGSVRGLERAELKGGDMLRVINKWWLVVVVLEPWDTAGWSKVGVAQQTSGPTS